MSDLFYKLTYARAEAPEDLPWHRELPPELFQEVARGRPTKGRALDLGCGAGIYTVWLAALGYEVVGVDYTPKALEMAERRAADHGVQLELIEADLTSWEGVGQFDLVMDAGFLHNFGDRHVRQSYRQRLLQWLSADGDYILGHFEKRHALDWRPIGPRRIRREHIVELFAPDLTLREHRAQHETVPLPIGPSFRLGVFHFQRAASATDG